MDGTTKVHKHRSRTREQTNEQRSKEEDEGGQGSVGRGAEPEHRDGNVGRKTARRPTTPSRLPPRHDSMSRRSSTTSVEIS